MWMVRFTTMAFALFNSLLIVGWVKRANPYLDFSAEPRRDLIKWINDVLTQKITGVINNAAPIVFLSVSPVGGTLLASIYAVYNNVFIMIKSLLHSVIDALRLRTKECLASGKPYIVHQLLCEPAEHGKYIQYPNSESTETLKSQIIEICELPQKQRDVIGQRALQFVLKNKNPRGQCVKMLERTSVWKR